MAAKENGKDLTVFSSFEPSHQSVFFKIPAVVHCCHPVPKQTMPNSGAWRSPIDCDLFICRQPIQVCSAYYTAHLTLQDRNIYYFRVRSAPVFVEKHMNSVPLWEC